MKKKKKSPPSFLICHAGSQGRMASLPLHCQSTEEVEMGELAGLCSSRLKEGWRRILVERWPGIRTWHPHPRVYPLHLTTFINWRGWIRQSMGSIVLRHSVVTDSLKLHGLWPARLLCPWDISGRNPEVSCHFLFQGSNCISCVAGGLVTAEPPEKPSKQIGYGQDERLRNMFYMVWRDSDVARRHPFGSWLFLFLSVFPWGNFLFIKLVYYIRRQLKCLNWSLASSKCSLNGCFNDNEENKRSTIQ